MSFFVLKFLYEFTNEADGTMALDTVAPPRVDVSSLETKLDMPSLEFRFPWCFSTSLALSLDELSLEDDDDDDDDEEAEDDDEEEVDESSSLPPLQHLRSFSSGLMHSVLFFSWFIQSRATELSQSL